MIYAGRCGGFFTEVIALSVLSCLGTRSDLTGSHVTICGGGGESWNI